MTHTSFTLEQIPATLFDAVNAPLLAGILRGVEKESLRVTADGRLAASTHPRALGSALTHPKITTDFSEALLEFITPPSHVPQVLMEQLHQVHAYTYSQLGDELLWASSMPCELGGDSEIPVALYGSSNRGRMKTVYRVGLGHRYGRVMQTVAGVHYNFSLPRALWALLHQQEGSTLELKDYIDKRYFDLIRNFRRHYWLLIYLFGASPAMSSSFAAGRPHDLSPLAGSPDTLYLPYATSLRMGDLGYQSSAQDGLFVCYNSLPTYVNTLAKAIFSPYPAYRDQGEFNGSGERIQLNTSLLQIENEFYSAIRPKRTAQAGETALTALCQRGVEYIEVRCLDLDPFSPLGITPAQVQFLDSFLMYCLLKDSPPCNREEFAAIGRNQKRVVREGRRPGLMLERNGRELSLQQWAGDLLAAMAPVAELLDHAHGTGQAHGSYLDALRQQQTKVEDVAATPSARVLSHLREAQAGFVEWTVSQANAFRQALLATPLSQDQRQAFAEMTEVSLSQQAREEAAPGEDFEAYLAAYYRQYHRCCQT